MNASLLLVTGHIPKHQALVVDHLGSYQNLANAWGMAMTALRYHKLKPHKENGMYEIYLTNPKSTRPEDTRTKIVVRLR